MRIVDLTKAGKARAKKKSRKGPTLTIVGGEANPEPKDVDSEAKAQPGVEKLLLLEDVADRLGVSLSTVRRLCQRGEMTRIKVLGSVRIAPSDLTAYLVRNRSGGRCGS